MAIELRDWNEFDEWAIKIYNEFVKHRNRYRVFSDCFRYTIVVDIKDNCKTGWSKRIIGDDWDDRIGIGVAFARLKGVEIPKVREMETTSFCSLEQGAFFNIYENNKYVEYCMVGYDYINDSYIATNTKTKKPRLFNWNDNRTLFVGKES